MAVLQVAAALPAAGNAAVQAILAGTLPASAAGAAEAEAAATVQAILAAAVAKAVAPEEPPAELVRYALPPAAVRIGDFGGSANICQQLPTFANISYIRSCYHRF